MFALKVIDRKTKKCSEKVTWFIIIHYCNDGDVFGSNSCRFGIRDINGPQTKHGTSSRLTMEIYNALKYNSNIKEIFISCLLCLSVQFISTLQHGSTSSQDNV